MTKGGAILGILVFIFYVAVAAPNLETEDSAEFAAGAKLLAMVHPPGYPLYLLIGHPFTALSDSPGYGLVLFSALAAALAVVFMYGLVRRRFGVTAALAAGLTLALARGLRESASGIEVYALTTLILTLLLGALLEFRRDPTARRIPMIGLLLGLTMSHHMGLLILLPAILPFLIYHGRVIPLRAWAGGLATWLVGLAPYLALLALSHRPDPPVIWWPPIETPAQLLHVMSGGPFKKLLFAVPAEEALRNLASFPMTLLASLPLVGALAALAGLFVTQRDDRPVFYLLTGIIGITFFHAANYDVLDPEVFLIPALPALAILAGYGFDGLARRFEATGRQCAWVIVLFVVAWSGGRFIEGGLLARRYNTLPVDVGRAVLAAHEGFHSGSALGDLRHPVAAEDTRSGSDSEALIWADWRYYPVLKYFQLVEGRGAGATVELDSTSETPGPTWREGRTWAMRPTYTLGESYALVMRDMHWKVETGIPASSFLPVEAWRDSPALLSIGGIELVAATWPEKVEFGRPIPIELIIRRASGAASDTVLGEIVLLWEGRRRLSTPFAPLHWHLLPPSMPEGAVYREPVETVIPSAHARNGEKDRWEIAVRFQSATGDTHLLLGAVRP
jgi:hypothetical protein